MWFARFFKSRSLSAKVCQGGKLKLNTKTINKANVLVKVDDVLTFEQNKDIRVIKVLDLGKRRGPAPEAILLYEDLAPIGAKPKIDPKESGEPAVRDYGSGRPTKRERRDMEKLRSDRF